MQLVLFFHFSCVTLSFLSEDPSFQTHVNCLSHFEPTFSSLYISMFIHDITHTVTHQEAAGGRVAGCCKFPHWQYVKGRHKTQKNKKKWPNSIAVQCLGSWSEMHIRGIVLDMCSGGSYKSPHPGDGWSIAHLRGINTSCSALLIHRDKPT